MKSTFLTLIASAAGLITFVVTRKIFRDNLKLGPPSLLAAVVAGLAFLGLTGRGEEPLAALLVPYEALALTLLILFLLFWIARLVTSRANRVRTQDEGDGWNPKRHRSRSPDRAPSSPPAKVRLPRGHARRPRSPNQVTHQSQAAAGDATQQMN